MDKRIVLIALVGLIVLNISCTKYIGVMHPSAIGY